MVAHPVERLYVYPPMVSGEILFAAAIGYFAWDLSMTLYYGYGFEYIFHAVLSAFVYTLPKAMPPSFLHFYGAFFLSWEATLPFICARHVMIKANLGSGLAFHIIQTVGFLLFIFLCLNYF